MNISDENVFKGRFNCFDNFIQVFNAICVLSDRHVLTKQYVL